MAAAAYPSGKEMIALAKRVEVPVPVPVPKSASAGVSVQIVDRMRSIWDHPTYRRIILVAGAGGVIFAAWHLYLKITELKGSIAVSSQLNIVLEKELEVESKKVEDKVIIHTSPRGFYTPAIATAPLQLETFLRVAGIPYEVNFCNEQDACEAPFMTYGEKTGNDFRECIRILSEKFDTNLEKDITASRRTASNLVDISLDNHFSWAILIWRWIHDEGRSMKDIQPINDLGLEVVGDVAQKVKEATRYHPIGQMDQVEFVKTINQGIHDISAALGRHKFFQGQVPGQVDCHAFAVLVQIMWNMPGSPFESQLKKYQNLVDFVRRMKEKYWPDWNELILKPKEFEEMYNVSARSRSVSREEKFKKRKGSGSKAKKTDGAQGTEENDEDSFNDQQNGDGASTEARKVNLGQAGKIEPELVKVTPKKQAEEDANKKGSDGNPPNTRASPAGILKTGNNTAYNNASVPKPRSGLVNASGGQTSFVPPAPQVQGNKKSETVVPVGGNRSQTGQPSNATGQLNSLNNDSMLDVHKPSVKFAQNALSIESTMLQGNNGVSNSQIPVRKTQPPSDAALPNPNSPIRPAEVHLGNLQAKSTPSNNGNNNTTQQRMTPNAGKLDENGAGSLQPKPNNLGPMVQQQGNYPASGPIMPSTPLPSQQMQQQQQGFQSRPPSQQYNPNGPQQQFNQPMFNPQQYAGQQPPYAQNGYNNGPQPQQFPQQQMPFNGPPPQFNSNGYPNGPQQQQQFNPNGPQQNNMFGTMAPSNFPRPVYPTPNQGGPAFPQQQQQIQYGMESAGSLPPSPNFSIDQYFGNGPQNYGYPGGMYDGQFQPATAVEQIDPATLRRWY